MTADQAPVPGDDLVALLDRWEGAGGTWRVLARHGDLVTIALLQCDGGSEADPLTSADPGLARYLAGRSSSEEAAVPRM